MARGARPPRPAAAAALLVFMAVACAAVDHLAPGVCPSIDIRNSPEQMVKLRGCRVIEGQLSIVLMERATTQTFENMSFPELREVTGYILIYRLKGIRNLGDLFPNLSVVRGMQLYKDYSIIIFDNEHLESLGLRSLTVVQRGAVRIQHNDRLCYVDTIDWTRIMAEEGADNNIIRSNYDTRLCGLCPNAQSRTDDHTEGNVCPTDSNHKLLCWDEDHCQRVCPSKCSGRACTRDGVCCHAACLGGCDGPSASDCHVCRGFSFLYGAERKCVDRCPPKTYELYWRCVLEHECRSMPPPYGVGHETQSRPAPNIRAYKILNNKSCVYFCPSGYIESGDARNATCQPCPPSGCVRECSGGRVDSVAAAEQFRGCTHIKGTLELAIRASRSNTMAILEASLGEIREIEGCLKVVRSYPLVSLMFLKNLMKITGSPDVEKSQALHIFNNPNLELLWDWSIHQPISISSGTLYIHFNPKLCNNQIMPLKNMTKDGTATFDEIAISDNGDQATCFQETLDLQVSELHKHVAILAWNMFCVDDLRKLLGFSIYYIQADRNVTLYEQRDACSDTWNVLDIPREEVRNSSRAGPENATSILGNPCSGIQPIFHPLTQLTPFTRYAAYVKAFTTSQDKKGAQSPIIYFQTLPSRPSPPLSVNVEIESAHSVNVKWSPPTMPNGTISIYHVEIQANSYNRPKIIATNINHCANPSALSNNIVFKSEQQTMKEKDESTTGDVNKLGTCACKEDEQKETKFSFRAEEEAYDNIQFENSLQNMVYLKNSMNRTGKTANKSGSSRIKRTVEVVTNSLDNMLVILSGNSHPQWGGNYTNATDEGGYVKSLFYQLDGNTRTLSVENMKHFTWYTVNVWACRVKHPNETKEAYKENWCSVRAFNTFRTLELVNADTVSNLQSYIIPSNKTLPEVNMTWEPPKNPNGFVVAYNVHYSKVEDNGQTQDVGLASCVNSDDFESNGRSYLLRNLLSGNYSLKVTPITIKGAGNTSDVFIFIPERTIDSGHEWIWAVIGGCIITLLVLGGGIWYLRRGLLPPGEANKLFASVNPEYVSTVYVPDEWEVPRGSIEFIRELGQGSFGMVYEGLAKNIHKGVPETRCAVKTVNEHATDRERIEFLNEASVMKAFDTFHVVRLLGVVSHGQPTLVIMELMELGDLKTYLRSHRPDNDGSIPKKDGNEPPSLQSILQMAIEIADGMSYLSAKKFVHRDLAARNCMVAGDLTVKVGDFGMTRDIYETDYYRKGSKGLLPVRWMSPESLKDGVFSSNSDVWSFGVVLWEMATLAMQPYQGLSNEQVVRYVIEGGVIDRPEHCPDRLYELMRACWSHRPAARPSFLQLVADLTPTSQPFFRHRSFFHSPQGQEMYALQRTAMEDSGSVSEVNVGAVATGSGSNLFGVSGRLASWVRELSSLRSREPDAAAEPLQPVSDKGPNGIIRESQDAEATGC